MKFTLTKAKINSTDSQFYYRFKIYYGKGKKSLYIPLKDFKLWNTPESTKQKVENKLNKQKVEERFDTLKSVVRSNKITISIPQSNEVEDAEVQNEIRKAIERAWRKEAKEYLPKRVEELASKHKFDYKKVAVKNSKTRWGSCSFDNSINLSLHLMRLPDHLVDYVILHELVHTKIKNHSRDFWQLLDIVSGNAKKLDREVKDCRIQIY